MKRVIALVLLLSGVMALFAFNVYAADDTWIRGTYHYSGIAGDLVYSATAAMLNYNTESTLYGGIHAPVLVTATLTNQSSSDILVNNATILLDFSGYAWIQNYDNYTEDLILVPTNNTGDGNHQVTYYLRSDNDFSYNAGFVVPAHSSLYLVTQLDVYAEYDPSTTNITSVDLNGITLNIAPSNVTSGNYPTSKNPINLSGIENYLSTISNSIGSFATLFNQESNDTQALISAQNTILTDIKNQIQFTGTFTPPNMQAYANAGREYTDEDYYVNLRLIRYNSFPISYDFELNGNGQYQYGMKRYVIQAALRLDCQSTFRVRIVQLKHCIEYNGYYPYIVDIKSDVFSYGYVLGNSIYLITKYPDQDATDRMYIPKGSNYALITMYLDVPLDYIAGFRALDEGEKLVVLANKSNSNVNIFPSIEWGVYNIYNSLQSSASSGISSESNSLNQTESQVHQQEQLYFQQNAQAILDTGLSNYRFNTEQSNGISSVSIDFTQLWNALGSWNSVYIFALTLTIALTILRHAPNAISTVRRRNYDNNERSS